MSFKSLLIANRGEIALRVMRTARRMGLRTIAVYSDADRCAPHVRFADEAVHVGGSAPSQSYLNSKSLIEAAKRANAQSVHPGYGFLAESAQFAQAVLDAGLAWIGPPPDAIRAMGDKANAKRLMAKAGVPVLPTYERDPEFPVMVKALAGGGGRGIRIVHSQSELKQALKTASSEAEHSFGDGRLLLEKALERARHVEVQVFADGLGNCIHLGERDCSVQRRHQKLIEESPSPAVDAGLRAKMGEAAVAAARAVGYVGAGTVEFLLGEDGKFWFMEMNTRLQVEHPVTEALTGLDLVEWQLRVARGEPLPLVQDEVRFCGHAIEARLCAEDPAAGFVPHTGTLLAWEPSPAVRVEHALEPGIAIPPYYDSMIAKLIAHAATREEARMRLAEALDATVALGVPTNKAFLAAVLRCEAFARGEATTDFLSHREFTPAAPAEAQYSLAASLLAASAGHGEWTGWSSNPQHLLRVKFGEEEKSFRYAAPPAGVASVVQAEVVHFAQGGASWRLENALHAPPARKAGIGGDGRLAAPMNGRVVAVHAKVGERIEAGAALVVLEAMKMEHALTLACAAKITALHVAPGMQVAPGNLLLEYEAA